MGVIIVSSGLDFGYHGTINNFFRNAKIGRTNAPVIEYLRILGDHFEASCFIELLGSSRKNLCQ